MASMRNNNLRFVFGNVQNFTVLLNAGKETDLNLQ